jgi:hypothetical protein
MIILTRLQGGDTTLSSKSRHEASHPLLNGDASELFVIMEDSSGNIGPDTPTIEPKLNPFHAYASWTKACDVNPDSLQLKSGLGSSPSFVAEFNVDSDSNARKQSKLTFQDVPSPGAFDNHLFSRTASLLWQQQPDL